MADSDRLHFSRIVLRRSEIWPLPHGSQLYWRAFAATCYERYYDPARSRRSSCTRGPGRPRPCPVALLPDHGETSPVTATSDQHASLKLIAFPLHTRDRLAGRWTTDASRGLCSYPFWELRAHWCIGNSAPKDHMSWYNYWCSSCT